MAVVLKARRALSAPQAVGYVRERRPIVDPIGSFPDLLKRLEKALREKKA